MPYLIDGHNLIGAMPGRRLAEPEDEAELIALLRSFSAATGKALTVYFDRRAPGSTNPPKSGRLTVKFVSESSSADRAIRAHLARLGGEARNWTVVSSDREVMLAARQAGAKAAPSTDFLRLLGSPRPEAPGSEKPDAPLSPGENEQLLHEFEAAGGKPPGRPI
jgi:uncharacterized protein